MVSNVSVRKYLAWLKRLVEIPPLVVQTSNN